MAADGKRIAEPRVRAVVAGLDAYPEARDYRTRVELVGAPASVEDRSNQKRPGGTATR